MARNLRVVGEKLSNLTEFAKESLEIVEERKDEVFDKQGGTLKWQSLAASTQRARANKWGYYKKGASNPGILRWTGNLQDNVTKKASANEAFLGFNASYAKYHQSGGAHLPTRKVVDWDNKTKTKIIKALQKHLHESFGSFSDKRF